MAALGHSIFFWGGACDLDFIDSFRMSCLWGFGLLDVGGRSLGTKQRCSTNQMFLWSLQQQKDTVNPEAQVGVSEIRDTLFWGPYNKDPTI